ncbi:RICIN domain-containing protein [Streptomyces sp. MCA2]|uniref:RICIN domain-containing protein n=1 Tax=Streptomyces sp. MCA2 TaxID=2944805 RepID=UPI00201FC2B9|nr:ricin-type beta-trefoil lectin domain protein [Streptomyces sp. MCA2]MCL7493848.1 RICIN domain-containing protein [Streptomyces sp. MCA2]
MRRVLPLAVSAVVLALTTVSPASAADRQVPPDSSNVQLRTDGFPEGQCLDSDGSGKVYNKPCRPDNEYQKWTWYSRGGNNLMLRNVAAGRCLDSSADGSTYTSECAIQNRYQQWTYREDNVGRYEFKDIASERCVQYNIDNDVWTDTCFSRGSWYIDAVS